jgi:hypothetical protein
MPSSVAASPITTPSADAPPANSERSASNASAPTPSCVSTSITESG